MTASIIRLGNEQRVNTTTAYNEEDPSVAALDGGGWIVAWQSHNENGTSIYQQRYDAAGNPDPKGEVKIGGSDASRNVSVTALAGGSWLTTWSDNGDIYQQRYDASGNPDPSGAVRVNTSTEHDFFVPVVTTLRDGGWLVTWSSSDPDASAWNVYQRRYDADGNPDPKGEMLVNTTTQNTQWRQSVTALADGGWVVTWDSMGQDGDSGGVYQQRYDANGNPFQGETRVNTTTVLAQSESSVTALADGGWLVTWRSRVDITGGEGIYQQRYDKDGAAIGGEQVVATTMSGGLVQPSVTALEDGGWLVTWASADQHDFRASIYQQRFDKDGVAVGAEQLASGRTNDISFGPRVTNLEDSGWLVTWTSFNQYGSDSDVYQRRFTSVTAFGEGLEHGTGTGEDDLFQVRNGGLGIGDSLEAGGGRDILRMIEAGTLDLTAPDKLTGVETVEGTGGSDIIVANAERFAGITSLQGGAGQDTLRLTAGTYDFSTKSVGGFEAITLLGTGSITFTNKAAAFLVHSDTKDGALILTGDSFTFAERAQLYHQGIRKVTDAGGVHVLQEAQASLSMQTVTENTSPGTIIGTLSATDPNPGDGLRFELIDSAGGRFALSGNQLVVGNGSLLDYEAGAVHRIVVRVIDEGGIATDAAFTITLSDVPVEILKGTSKGDVLKGGTGRDVLYGGNGKDTLTGDAGQDVFVFNTKPNKKSNLDKVTDFNVKDDAIWLDNSVFKALGKKGTEAKPAQLTKDFFIKGSKAKDKNDYVIYDNKKGVLYYDADGSGKGKQVEIATLSKKLAMTYKDFFVI